METAQVTDLYQASYLLLSGCELTAIECIPTGGAISCRMSFQGERLPELLDDWFARRAAANLYSFRTAYGQINTWVHQAKKSHDRLSRKGGPDSEGVGA
jgi:hypothetical protein